MSTPARTPTGQRSHCVSPAPVWPSAGNTWQPHRRRNARPGWSRGCGSPPRGCAPLAEPRPPTGTDRAAAWLIEQLRSGPVISTQIHADAAEAGIQRHTLALARRRLNVQLERLTGQRGGARYWTL